MLQSHHYLLFLTKGRLFNQPILLNAYDDQSEAIAEGAKLMNAFSALHVRGVSVIVRKYNADSYETPLDSIVLKAQKRSEYIDEPEDNETVEKPVRKSRKNSKVEDGDNDQNT